MTRAHSAAVIGLLIALVGIPGTAALAQNRIVNGSFDESLVAWSADNADGRSASWNSDDANGSAGSGSVEIRHTGAGTGFAVMVLSQCVSLSGMPTGTTPFGLRTKALQESAAIVAAHASLSFYQDYRCEHFFSPGPNLSFPPNLSNWNSENTSFERNAQVNSVLVELGISRNVGADASGAVRFDDLYIGTPGPGPAVARLSRWTVDGGGGRGLGGSYALSGTIGQPDAGRSEAGALRLYGGFWIPRGGGSPVLDVIFRDRFQAP